MNTRTSRFLSKVLRNHLRFDGVIMEEQWLNETRCLRVDESPAQLTMDIIIYGQQHNGDDVAKDLSRHGLYLQHPRWFNQSVQYSNPQFLDLKEYLPLSEECCENSPSSMWDEKATTNSLSSCLIENMHAELEQMLASLPQHDYLNEIDSDYRVRTLLLRYATIILFI